MDNFSLKSCFISDFTLRPTKPKPSDEEIQEAKLLYYYPDNEHIEIKRSNIGIIEGTVSFLDTFSADTSPDNTTEEDSNQFILIEMLRCYYISAKFENNKHIGFILNKPHQTSEYTNTQNIITLKKWFYSLLKNFYNTFVLFNGEFQSYFFPVNHMLLRQDPDFMKAKYLSITDFIDNYFTYIKQAKMSIPFMEHILYFPLNEVSHTHILLATQRLCEKLPDIRHTSITYKGYLLNNEIPLDSFTLLYNSFHNSLDASPLYNNFNRPPYQVIQTVNSGIDQNQSSFPINSNYRKSFDSGTDASKYLIGINRININNFHLFIPTVYIQQTNEKYKLLVYSHMGLTIFIFLSESFNASLKINSLMKMEGLVKRFFNDEMPVLDSLYIQKMSKVDTTTYAYLNNSNKSIKLSSVFFNKKNKLIDEEKVSLLKNILKIDWNVNYSAITRILNFYVCYLVSFERRVVVIFSDNLNLSTIKSMMEETKKDLFDYIFIL